MPAKLFWIDCRFPAETGSSLCCGRLRREAVVRSAKVFSAARVVGAGGGWAICRGKAFQPPLNCMCAVSFATTTNAVNTYSRSDSEKRLRSALLPSAGGDSAPEPLAHYETVMELVRRDLSQCAIVRLCGMDRKAVREWNLAQGLGFSTRPNRKIFRFDRRL